MGSHSVTCHPTEVNTPHLNPSQTGWYSIYLTCLPTIVLLLILSNVSIVIAYFVYLISKSVHVIGRNRVTWRSVNLASALTRHLLPSLIMHVSFDISKQQLEPLD